MDIILTTKQNNVKEKILKHLKEVKRGDVFGENSFISLIGAAGTGKTTLTKFLVKELLDNNWRICITGPTHMSVKVIRNIIGINHENLKFASIHSFLGLKPGPIDLKTGERKFKKSSNKYLSEISKEHFDIVINDESSMISQEMFNFLKDEMYNVCRIESVLLIGDEMQLSPVEDNKLEQNPKHAIYDNDKINHYKLTELIRNPDMEVVNFVTSIRKMIENKNTKLDLFTFLVNERDNKNHKKVKFYKTKKEFIKEFIKEDRLGNDNDIIGTFTNDKVQEYNEKIRNYYTKDEDGVVPEIHPMDLFVVLESTQNNLNFGQDGFVNSEILSLKQSTFEDFNFKGRIFKGYKCITEDNRKFNKLANESKELYERSLELLKANAVNTKNKKDWDLYYTLLNLFLKVRPHYAETLHRLQGSSYRDVYVDLGNLVYINSDELLRLFYVGCTRAKRNVHLVL